MSGAVIEAVEACMSGWDGEARRPSHWIILRCAPTSTLTLCDAMVAKGVSAFAPRAMASGRVPRRRVKVVAPKPVPVMPCYVFADAQSVVLVQWLAANAKDVLGFGFSVMLLPDRRIARVSDRQLEVLREMERRLARKAPKGERQVFRVGEPVSVLGDVAWRGMSGIVEQAAGKWALVCFGGKVSVKIDALHLIGDEAHSAQPKGAAAIEAASGVHRAGV